MKDKRIGMIAILLGLSIVNFSRISRTENIRTVSILSIFVVGVLSGILLISLITKFKNRS